MGDIKVSVKRLKWSDETIADITDILLTQIKKKDFNEMHLVTKYREYLKKNGLTGS